MWCFILKVPDSMINGWLTEYMLARVHPESSPRTIMPKYWGPLSSGEPCFSPRTKAGVWILPKGTRGQKKKMDGQKFELEKTNNRASDINARIHCKKFMSKDKFSDWTYITFWKEASYFGIFRAFIQYAYRAVSSLGWNIACLTDIGLRSRC